MMGLGYSNAGKSILITGGSHGFGEGPPDGVPKVVCKPSPTSKNEVRSRPRNGGNFVRTDVTDSNRTSTPWPRQRHTVAV